MLQVYNTKINNKNYVSPYKGLISKKTLSFVDYHNDLYDYKQQRATTKTEEPEVAKTIFSSQNGSSNAKKQKQEEPIATKIPQHYKTSHLNRLKQLLKPMLIASYKSQQEAEDIAKEYGLEFINRFSTENTYVYFDKATNFPLIVHRGSVTAEDWLISDVLIASGLSRIFQPRVSKAREITKQVQDFYKTEADAFGSSLGGNIAENSGAKGYILTHNKAAGLGDVFKKTNKSRQIDYRSKKDIVSLLAETQDTTIKYLNDDGFLTAHSLNTLKEGQQDRRR